MNNLNLTEDLAKEMAENGVIFGHKKTKTNPKIKPYISLSRQEIEIFEPTIIWESLQRAKEFIKEKIKNGEKILFVATTSGAKKPISEWAKELQMPYVINRWLGGTLTNFKVISNRLKYYLDLKAKQEKGELTKYSKKEQIIFNKQIQKMAINFEGLENFTELPQAIFIVDPYSHQTALREAKRLKLPIIAILDNDDDPSLIDYPIVANDHAPKSLNWLIEKIKEGLIEEKNDLSQNEKNAEVQNSFKES